VLGPFVAPMPKTYLLNREGRVTMPHALQREIRLILRRLVQGALAAVLRDADDAIHAAPVSGQAEDRRAVRRAVVRGQEIAEDLQRLPALEDHRFASVLREGLYFRATRVEGARRAGQAAEQAAQAGAHARLPFLHGLRRLFLPGHRRNGLFPTVSGIEFRVHLFSCVMAGQDGAGWQSSPRTGCEKQTLCQTS